MLELIDYIFLIAGLIVIGIAVVMLLMLIIGVWPFHERTKNT